MARYATSQGKGPKKKKREQLKASTYTSVYSYDDGKRATWKKETKKVNDGKPYHHETRTYKDKDKGYQKTRIRRYNESSKYPVKGKGKGAVERTKEEKRSKSSSKGDRARQAHKTNIRKEYYNRINKQNYRDQLKRKGH